MTHYTYLQNFTTTKHHFIALKLCHILQQCNACTSQFAAKMNLTVVFILYVLVWIKILTVYFPACEFLLSCNI